MYKCIIAKPTGNVMYVVSHELFSAVNTKAMRRATKNWEMWNVPRLPPSKTHCQFEQSRDGKIKMEKAAKKKKKNQIILVSIFFCARSFLFLVGRVFREKNKIMSAQKTAIPYDSCVCVCFCFLAVLSSIHKDTDYGYGQWASSTAHCFQWLFQLISSVSASSFAPALSA